MADPNPDDVPEAMRGTLVDPWSWVPPEWQHPNIDAPGIDAMFDGIHPDTQIPVHPTQAAAIMQPGLGIPAATLDAAASSPAQPLPPPGGAMQPGLGIPQSTIDSAAAAPAQPAPVPDAISGADERPSVADMTSPITFGANPGSMPAAQPYGVPVSPMDLGALPSDVTTARAAPEDPDQPQTELSKLTEQQARDLAIKDPVKFATIVAGANKDWEKHYADQMQLHREQTDLEERGALKAYQQATAATQVKMDALYKQADQISKIDPNRYKNSRSMGRTLLDVIGAIAGGISAGQVPGGNGVNHYLDWFQKDVDNDIAAQKDDIENQKFGINTKKGILAEEFARTGNMYQATQAVRLGMYSRAANALLTEQQKYDPASRRNAAIGQAAAEMQSRITAAQQALHQQTLETELKTSKTQLEYMTQQATERHAKAEEATARANTSMVGWGHAITKAHNIEQEKAENRRLDIEADKEANAKAKTGPAAELEAEGISNPSTGEYILRPEGQRYIDAAKKLERDAAKLPAGDSNAQLMLAKAKDIRQQADLDYGVKIKSKEIREKLQPELVANQSLIDSISDIKRAMDDLSVTDRTGWASVGSKFAQAKVNYIQAHGAKPSSREMDAIEEVFGDSPDGIKARTINQGKVRAALDAVQQEAIRETTTQLRTYAHLKGEYKPDVPDGEASEKIQGTTAAEAYDKAEPGRLRNAAGWLTGVDKITGDAESRQLDAENAVHTPTGLSEEDDGTVVKLMDRYRNGDDDVRDKAVSKLAGFASSPRESVASGVLARLRDDRALYDEVLSKLPAAKRKNLQSFDNVHLPPLGSVK